MKRKKTFHFVQIMGLLLALSIFMQSGIVQASQSKSIETVDLILSTNDIARVEFGYHHSSFQSYHVEYKLDAKEGLLTDGNITMPLSSLKPLLSGLRGMYPGTRPLIWQNWTDDYPHAWVNLYLNDGRAVQISSDSQFAGMLPWNVLSWASEKAYQPEAVYIQLNPILLDGIDLLWREVGEEGFPRKHDIATFWEDRYIHSVPETIKFNIPRQYVADMDDADAAPVWGARPDALTFFIPELYRSSEIKTLLDAGYKIYDAAFTLEVETETLKPVKYNGMLALVTPDGKDAVVGLVVLPFSKDQPITTTFNAAESMHLVEQRRSSIFLNGATQLLAPLTFLLDTREGMDALTLDCPKDREISLDGEIIQAIWNPVQPWRVTFYPITDDRWSVDIGIRRGDPNWDDTTVEAILKSWFPDSIASLSPQVIQEIDSSWRIAFQPDLTLDAPQLLSQLISDLPEQTIVHEQNPEKAGDYSFLSLDGRIIASENGAAPVVAYCGETLPNWYSPAYPIEKVMLPNDQAPRQNMASVKSVNGKWHSLGEPLPKGAPFWSLADGAKLNWTSISFTQPGFLHVLWSKERDGVYYADGWIDGTGWTNPQRLGDDAYWLETKAWPDGEIHLFWDAGLTTRGSIHVWRPAGGVWQEQENWPIAYFSEILRDSSGVLHIGSIESDGLDGEFMHRTWSPETGLSNPENISRMVGDIGNTTTVLRLDSDGRLHAAWSHILEQKSIPDPITGETSDISGVFYAYQLPDGQHWSKPEQIGALAAYAHAVRMELDTQGNPLILWQADNGLVSRIRKNDLWEEAIEIVKVKPPEMPAEFGPDRWVQPTAELQTGVDSDGRIVVGWLIPYSELKLGFWSGSQWIEIVDVLTPEESQSLESEPLTLQMVVDNKNQVHFVFFQENTLHYGLYDHTKTEIKPLDISYDLYGLPEASLLVDGTGSIAVLGLPRTPRYSVKTPFEGIPPTPMPLPTATPLPTITPEGTTQSTQPNKNGDLPLIAIGIVVILIGMGTTIIVKRKRRLTS